MNYLFILSTPDGSRIVPGYTSNIVKSVAFYNGMPTLDPTRRLRLVYIEMHTDKETAYDNFLTYSQNPRGAVVDHIKQQNPELVELVPGTHFDI